MAIKQEVQQNLDLMKIAKNLATDYAKSKVSEAVTGTKEFTKKWIKGEVDLPTEIGKIAEQKMADKTKGPSFLGIQKTPRDVINEQMLLNRLSVASNIPQGFRDVAGAAYASFAAGTGTPSMESQLKGAAGPLRVLYGTLGTFSPKFAGTNIMENVFLGGVKGIKEKKPIGEMMALGIGKDITPSESLNIQNPVLSMATDIGFNLATGKLYGKVGEKIQYKTDKKAIKGYLSKMGKEGEALAKEEITPILKTEPIVTKPTEYVKTGDLLNPTTKQTLNTDLSGDIRVSTSSRIPTPAEKMTGMKERGLVDDIRSNKLVPEQIKQTYTNTYNQLSGLPMFKEAESYVNTSYDDAISKFNSGQLSPEYTTPVGWNLALKAFNEGRSADAVKIIDTMAERSTQFGQSNAFIAQLGKFTPSGMLNYAAKKFQSVAKDASPNLEPLINDTTKALNQANQKGIQGVLFDFDKYTVDEVRGMIGPEVSMKELPSEKLAGKISERVTAKPTEIKADPVADMINTLYKVASEDIPVPMRKGRNPLEFVVEALKNKENYVTTWNKAKNIVMEKFKNNPEALQKLQKFEQNGLDPTFYKMDGNKVVANTIKDLNIKVKDVVRKHFTEVDTTGRTLSEKLVADSGLDAENAKILEKFVIKRFNEIVTETKTKELQKLFKQNKILNGIGQQKDKKQLIQNLVEWSNLGAFQRGDLYEQVAKKMGLPYLDAQFADSLYKQMDAIQRMEDGPIKDAMIQKVYEDIQRKIPFTKAELLSLYQSNNILSNIGVQLGNIYTGTKATLLDIPLTKAFSGQLGEVPGYYKNVFKAIPQAINDFKVAFKGGTIGAPDFREVRSGLAPRFLTTSLRTMEGVDKFYTRLILNALGDNEDAIKQADYFLRRTDLNSKDMSQGAALRAIDQAAEGITNLRKAKLIGPVVRFAVPFIRYGINLFKQKLEYSPLGYTPWFSKEDSFANGKALIGTVAMIHALYSAFSDKLVGAAPKSENERKLFFGSGKIPYSMKIGKKYISFNALEQYSLPYVFATTLRDNMSKIEKMSPDQIDEIAQAVFDSFVQTFVKEAGSTGLSSVNRLSNFLSGDQQFAPTYVGGLIKGVVPYSGLISSINSLIDNVSRKQKEALDPLKAMTPGLSKTLEPYTGIYGEEQKASIGTGVLPFRVSQEKQDYLKSGLVEPKVSEAPTANLYEEYKKLTPEQQQKYSEFLYANDRNTYYSLVRIGTWDALGLTQEEKDIYKLGVTNGERAKAIYDIYEKSGRDANVLNKFIQSKIATEEVLKQISEMYKGKK